MKKPERVLAAIHPGTSSPGRRSLRILSRLLTRASVSSIALIFLFVSVVAQDKSSTWPPQKTELLSADDWSEAFSRAKSAQSDFQVESVDEFKAITNHYQSLVNDGEVVNRFHLRSGELIQCVSIYTQRSFLQQGGVTGAIPSPPSALSSAAAIAQPQKNGELFGLDRALDEDGNIRQCPEGSFPKLIPSLEDLYRFSSLTDFFRKNPRQEAPEAAGDGHEWAGAIRNVNNWGSFANFSIWSPFVAPANEFSLSQLWVSRGSGSDLQTAEGGWQKYPQFYGNNNPHLFIYFTKQNYADNQGCYNLTCTGFVQVDNSIVIGGSLSPVSVIGGTQNQAQIGFIRDTNSPPNWWLLFNNVYVGYYPTTLYDSQGLASMSDRVNFGGEVINLATGGSHTTTQMGSGRFPSEGLNNAAYTRNLKYRDTNNTDREATDLQRYVHDSNGASVTNYYDLILNPSSVSGWGQWFLFGGPGRGTKSDLTITAGTQFVNPTSVAAGSNINAGCSEDNSGAVTAEANVVSLYLSTDAVLTPGSNGDTYLGFVQFPSVAANSNSLVKSNNIQIPSGTAPGTYYLFFWADGEQIVDEISESNNFATRQVTVTSAAQNYTITLNASPSAGGTLSGGGTFAANSSRTVTATANSGYSFTNWTENGSVVNSSASYNFTLNSNRNLVANFTATLLAPPTLVSPGTTTAPGSSIGTLTPTFNWQPVTGADGYALYVSKFNGSTYDLVFNSETDVGHPLTGTSYVLPGGKLQNGAQYRWNMSSHNGAGYGTPNTSRYYFNVSLSTCNSPGGFSLTSPSIGQSYSSTTTSVPLSWGVSANADSYDVYFGTSSNPPFLANQTLTNRNVTVTPGQYWWKVVAKANCGSATVSTAISSFSVQQSTTSSVQFSSATYSVNENGGSRTITVTRMGGTSAFVVNYRTSNGTATAGADYTAINEVLNFATNETSKTFTVPIINDTLVEGNETLNLTLSNPSGGVTLGSPSTAVLTIVDNDTACTYSLSESEHTVSPDDTAVKFFMDAPSGCAWTAVSDSQSWLTTSSSGSGDGTISYNTAMNPSSNPRVGHIAVGGQVYTVTQIGVGGAGNVRFSSVTYTSNEGGGNATITVARTGGTGTGIVQYSTSNGTATAGVDFVSASGTLLFVGDETSKTFNVTILDDTTFEGDESFSLSLNNNSSSFTLGSPSTATLTIIENDTPSLQLLLEEFGPSSSQVAALDSILFSRDPFPVVNGANLLNLGLDRNTRVIIFATNLQLTQGEPSSSVVVNLVDSNNQNYDIAAEDVRPVPNSNFTQVIFRLPNNLPVGTCTIKVKAHGQVSNAGTISIRI